MTARARARLCGLIGASAVAATLAPPGAQATPLAGWSIPRPVSPAADAEIPVGTIPTFVVERGPGGSNYGGRYDGSLDRYDVAVSADPTVLSHGVIQSEADHGYGLRNVVPQLTWQWTPAARTYLGDWWLNTPGVYYWQPYRNDCYQDTDCRVEGPMRRLRVVEAPAATERPEPAGPAPAPAVLAPPTPPPVTPAPPPAKPAPPPVRPAPAPKQPPVDWNAGLTTATIPMRLGRARNDRRYWVNDRDVPFDVNAERFLALARNAGLRWGNRMRGTTSRRPRRDGRNTVAFGTTHRAALGTAVSYVRVRRRMVCGPYRCRPRVVSRRFTGETDVIINRRVRWEQGPEPPGSRRWDLESVLIHEMGHFAGNDHVGGSRCRNHPMRVALGPGEYWRGPGDWHFLGCGPRAHGGAARKPRPFTTRVVVVRR